MKRIATVVPTLAFVLAVALGACSSSKSATTSSSSTTGPATSVAGATTTAAASTTVAAASFDAGAFCARLVAATDRVASFRAAIGTPELAAKLAEVRADNAAIVAASPDELRDAITRVYRVSEMGQKALDPTLSAADKRAATLAIAAEVRKPELKAAIATYKAWVQAHCGSSAAKILAGGL